MVIFLLVLALLCLVLGVIGPGLAKLLIIVAVILALASVASGRRSR